MENNNNNQRKINADLQEITHLAIAMRSLASVLGIRVDDVVLKQNNRRRKEDDSKEKKE